MCIEVMVCYISVFFLRHSVDSEEVWLRVGEMMSKRVWTVRTCFKSMTDISILNRLTQFYLENGYQNVDATGSTIYVLE